MKSWAMRILQNLSDEEATELAERVDFLLTVIPPMILSPREFFRNYRAARREFCPVLEALAMAGCCGSGDIECLLSWRFRQIMNEENGEGEARC